jgi:hypothetical protein
MSDEGWIRYKSQTVLRYTLEALQHLSAYPCAQLYERPLEGQTAFVVGAGSSLQKNEHMLTKAARCGTVFATNSGVRAIAPYALPHVLIARESISVADEVADSPAELVVLDVGCHPDMWPAAGARTAWFMPGYPRHYQLLAALGVPPVFGGTAAFTTAVALALRWGAERVVLIGADLSYAPNGESYHPRAPRGEQRISHRWVGGELIVNIEKDEFAMKREAANGIKVHTRELRGVMVEGWGGGPSVVSTEVLTDQIDWLEEKAAEYPGVIMLNATEGGAHIPGWSECTLDAAIDIAQRGDRDIRPRKPAVTRPTTWKRSAAMVPAARVEALRDQLRSDAVSLGELAAVMNRGDGGALRDLVAIKGLHRGNTLIEALADHELIDANAVRPEGVERVKFAYQAWGRAAAVALEALR